MGVESEPVVSYAVLFPGQGSQFVGMGADLFDEHPDLLGDRSDQILGWSLKGLCLDGPEERLTRTEFAQPALFALSYALWTSFVDSVGEVPVAAAGHSLGEYSALAAAGVFGYDDGLRLVARRGSLMAEAADLTNSGMAALLGVDEDIARAVVAANVASGGTLQIANVNAPGQIVVAGSESDLGWLVDNGRELGVRRSIPLKVAGAFHSTYMASAAAGLAADLEELTYSPPDFPVWANVTARPHESSELAATLQTQVTSPVLFQASLQAIASLPVDTFVHVGPGDVTAGLARKTLPDSNVFTVSTVEDADPVALSVGTM